MAPGTGFKPSTAFTRGWNQILTVQERYSKRQVGGDVATRQLGGQGLYLAAQHFGVLPACLDVGGDAKKAMAAFSKAGILVAHDGGAALPADAVRAASDGFAHLAIVDAEADKYIPGGF